MYLLSFADILDLPDYVVAILFFGPLLIGLFIYFYGTRHSRTWKKGIFPPKLKFNEDNLLEAYLSLGALMILLDYKSSKGKTQYINEYFNRYFPKSNYNFGDSLLFSMRYPIKVETVCAWFNQHLTEEGKKAQVIYFLTGLAMLNGKLGQQEKKYLIRINELLHLKESNLNRIIATYEAYHKMRAEQKEPEIRKRVDLSSEYKRTLGVPENASYEEIKKAYKKLVKLHHPDVFVGASEAEKKLAADQFVQIHHAYEKLMQEYKKTSQT